MDMVDSYPWWTNKSKTNSIWFITNDSWLDIYANWGIGLTSDIGSSKTVIHGPKYDENWT